MQHIVSYHKPNKQDGDEGILSTSTAFTSVNWPGTYMDAVNGTMVRAPSFSGFISFSASLACEYLDNEYYYKHTSLLFMHATDGIKRIGGVP